MFPIINETLYCPPCPPPRPEPVGKRSFGVFGARPELFTTTEEFSKPVPFPLPTKIVLPAIATADGYCPVGIKPRTLLRPPSPSCPSLSSTSRRDDDGTARLNAPTPNSTTANELLCELATYSVEWESASPSGELPIGVVSDNRTLIRSVSLSVFVSMTDTVSSSEFATNSRVSSSLRSSLVGCRPTPIKETVLFVDFRST